MASLERVRIGAICTPGVHRKLDEAAVERLRQSIATVGLLQPPIIRRIAGGQPWLVSGQHRLEACRRLGMDVVECIVIEAKDVDAELGTIAENLHRLDLTAMERDELTARWVALVAEREAGKVAQPAPVSEAKGGRGNEGGIRKAARELDMPRDAVRRAVKVASLTPAAKEAARDTGLDDNRAAMLKVAEKPPAKQAAAVREIAQAKAAPPAPKRIAELTRTQAALVGAWKAAPRKEQRWFLLWVQNGGEK